MSAVQKITDDVCFDEELGFRLKMLRQMKQMSQEELADSLKREFKSVAGRSRDDGKTHDR